MLPQKRIFKLSILAIVILATTACQPNSESDQDMEIAVAVAMTQTVAALETEKTPTTEPTETPVPEGSESNAQSQNSENNEEIPESVIPIESELQRVQFEQGEYSKEITSNLLPGAIDHYVLTAGAEQKFETNIYPPGVATVVITGADGTVLKSDLNNVSNWTGVIPSTQDYFIDVTSIVGIETKYSITISIPPLTPIATTGQISGSISYAGETNPALHIVAYNLESNLWYFLKTSENSFFYEIGSLPPGTYNLVAYSQENLASGHLSPIIVNAGESTENINFTTWVETGSSAFPPDPVNW